MSAYKTILWQCCSKKCNIVESGLSWKVLIFFVNTDKPGRAKKRSSNSTNTDERSFVKRKQRRLAIKSTSSQRV